MTSELETFLVKFRKLWKSGEDAHLEVECHAGQAWVGLHVRLGHEPGPLQPQHHFPHTAKRTRDGPSRQRRRARRAAARVLVEEQAEEACSEETIENEIVAEQAEEKEESTEEVVLSDSDVNLTKEDDNVAVMMETKDVAEEAKDEDKLDMDFDVYIFTFWDNEKPSEPQEAKDYLDSNLKLTFKKNKVKESDQVYKICTFEHLEGNELQVKVKMRKNNWPVELSARNLQTSGRDNPISVSIKTIQR